MKKIFNTQLAFGLIETIMASGIIVMVIGSLTLVSSVVLKSSRQTSEDLMANYLIHEVFESARQIRGTNYIDENIVNGVEVYTDWKYGIIGENENNRTVKLEFDNIMDVDGNEILYQKPKFTLTTSDESITKRNIIYSRKIKIEKISLDDDKIKIEVTISWGEGKQRKSAIILTNYEQGF